MTRFDGRYTDRCPICKSNDWQIDTTTLFTDFLIHSCSCLICDSEWKERFVFVDVTDIVDKRAGS